MNLLFRKALLLTLVCMAVLLKTVHTQSSSTSDSVRILLAYFHGNTKDEKLKQSIKEAQAIFTGNTINDSIAKKLLIIDSFLLAAVKPDRKMTLRYTELITHLLKQLPPLQKHFYYAKSLNNLAVLYYVMGQFEKSLFLLQQALAIFKKVLGEEHPYFASGLNNIAGLYKYQGQFEKALSLIQQALLIRKKVLGEEHPDYAFSLNNLAIIHSQMEQYEKALPLHLQALSISKKVLGEEHPYYAKNLNFLAILYRNLGQYEKAIPFQQQALAIIKKVLGVNQPEYAYSINNLALLYKDLGQYEKAMPLHQQALAIREKVLGEDHPVYATNLNDLGLLYSTLGNHNDASALLTKASDIKLRHLNQIYSTLSEQEKIIFINQESDQFFYIPSLLFTQTTKQSSFINRTFTNELTLKGMVLENQQQVMNSIRKSGDTTTLQLYEQWRQNRTRIGKQLLLPIKERIPYLDSLQEATNQQEQQLSRSATPFRNQQLQKKITVKEIASRLTKGQAAVEFIRFRLYHPKRSDSIMYAALVLLPKDTAARFVPLFEEKQLEQLLQLPADADISDAIEQQYENNNTGNSLYQLIWKPLEQHLSGIHNIYYAPAGLLHRISFQALSPDSTHSLIDRYQLQQVLSTRSLVLPVQTATTPLSASVWGHIDYSLSTGNKKLAGSQHTRGQSTPVDATTSSFNFYNWDTKDLRGGGEEWEPLPATKKEIDSLRKLLTKSGIPVTVNSAATATEEAFKALDGKSPNLLHLATHGFFLPVAESKPKLSFDQTGGSAFTVQQNPLFRSGLVLADGNKTWKGIPIKANKEDGILTAYEISQMDLGNTDVVVLSACETALGDLQGNEGVIGLQRAFKLAGVKQLIVSLWQVPDKFTMELMTAFYTNWLGGMNCREALQKAQLTIKENYKKPFYWASFVMVE